MRHRHRHVCTLGCVGLARLARRARSCRVADAQRPARTRSAVAPDIAGATTPYHARAASADTLRPRRASARSERSATIRGEAADRQRRDDRLTRATRACSARPRRSIVRPDGRGQDDSAFVPSAGRAWHIESSRRRSPIEDVCSPMVRLDAQRVSTVAERSWYSCMRYIREEERPTVHANHRRRARSRRPAETAVVRSLAVLAHCAMTTGRHAEDAAARCRIDLRASSWPVPRRRGRAELTLQTTMPLEWVSTLFPNELVWAKALTGRIRA